MSTAQTKLTLDGMLKDIFSDEGLLSLVPDNAILYKSIPFKAAQKVGRDFIQAVALTREHGYTYGAGIQTLQAAIVANVDDAKVRGAGLTLATAWSYDAAAAMASSKEAFMSGTEFRIKSLIESMTFRTELQMLHGSTGIGVADSTQDTVTAVVATKNATIPITAASWSPAIWSGAEGAYVSFFSTAAAAASAAAGGDSSNTVNKFEVASIDVVNKTITVITKDGTEAGILVGEVEAANYNVFFYGARTLEMVGVNAIAQNTGTLFGIDGSAYSMFKGNTFAAGGANLTLKKIYQAVAQACGRGLSEDCMCIVSPATFATLANDEAALRQYVSQVKKADRGVQSIEFTGPSGSILVVSHPLQFEGQAVIIPHKRASRIGSTDITMKRPGSNDEMLYDLPTQTGLGLRGYSEQAIFLPVPCMCCFVSGISNA